MFERELRDVSHVFRWGTSRAIHRQSVADHSYYVAIYSDQIATQIDWQGDRAALMRYALWHDVEETVTGDIVGPVKRVIKSSSLSTLATDHLYQRFPDGEWLKPDDQDIKKIVALANVVEEIFWLASEMQMGNMTLRAVYINSQSRMREKVKELDVISSVKVRLMAEIEAAMSRHLNSQSKIVEG